MTFNEALKKAMEAFSLPTGRPITATEMRQYIREVDAYISSLVTEPQNPEMQKFISAVVDRMAAALDLTALESAGHKLHPIHPPAEPGE